MTTIAKSRIAANLTIDAALLTEAKELKVNISRSAEAGVREAVRQSKRNAWKAENSEALKGWNDWVEKNGIPLDKYRQF